MKYIFLLFSLFVTLHTFAIKTINEDQIEAAQKTILLDLQEKTMNTFILINSVCQKRKY